MLCAIAIEQITSRWLLGVKKCQIVHNLKAVNKRETLAEHCHKSAAWQVATANNNTRGKWQTKNVSHRQKPPKTNCSGALLGR